MNPFIVDLEEFAERRSGQRQATENALFGSALYALRQFGQKGWADALIAKAKKKVRADFHDLTGAFTTKALREHVADWEKEVRAALAETHKPTEATIRQQAQTIATMLATSAHNIAMEAAGDVDEATIEKVWVSREDPKVRPTHAAAHGQRVPMSGSFTVGGFKMSRPGDLKAPIQETANCRCVLGLVQSREAVAASADGPRDGVLIVALPAAGDPVTEDSSEDQAHMTTIWFGSTDEAAVDPSVIGPTVERIASTLAPFTAKVERRGTLGDDEADVLFLDADDVRFLREALLADEDILNGMKSVQQYPEWTPHVTLGYPDAPGAERTVAAVKFDRLALWVAQERIEYPLGEVMENENEPDIPAPEHRLDYVDDPIPFWGVLAPEGIPSGDGRMFSTGALRARPLPLPLAYQKTNEPGHDGSYKVGNIEKMWRVPDNTLVYYSGHFLSTVDDVDEIIGIMAESGGMSGVSVDADDGVMELQDAVDDSGMELTVFSSARACGATLCNIPAFHEAFCALGSPPDIVTENAIPLSVESLAEQNSPAMNESLSAAGPVKTEDGPGWLTHPVDTDRLRDYWTHGRGAAKIMWGAPGDFNRCRANLAKYVKPQHLSGYCFTGDTEFLTRDGVTTFAEAVGTTQHVLTMKEPLGRGASPVTKSGYWVEAPIESFGEQRVLSVTLRRAGQRKVIGATPEHEWFASADARSTARLRAQKLRTDELRPGMALASLMPMPVAKRGTVPSPYGIAAGAVFGDGHRGPHGVTIDLWGDKDAQLLRYFEGNPMSAVKTQGGVLGTRVRGLPASWKGAPSLDEGPSYLLGWLAGYVAADGHVTKRGAISLSSANRDHLVLAQTVANRLGISTLPITSHMRIGKGSEPAPLFKLPFVGETFPEAALIVAEHRQRLQEASPKFSATRWVVESVEDHGEAEEVFCAVVPETETFALADYVWVHNCANRHYDALGFWPGDHRRMLKHSNDGEVMAPSVRLVASGGTDAPPREWFDDPGLTGPSPIVVTEEGRVFGHLATWGTCHIGFKDACTTPPQSLSDYAYFQTGAVLTTDGEVAVGQITVDTGHAGLSLSARPAAAHYDDTGTAVADVCAGEDEHGIYIAGAVRSSATPEQVARLRASALSGDWRTIGGNLELVAALAVNVPGFPIPRTSLAASGGHQTALVAAGIVEVAGQQVERASLEEIVGRAVDERLSADRRKSEMSQIMVKAGRDPRSRMKAIAKNRKG